VGHLRRCAVLAFSPVCLICPGRYAQNALHLAILAAFFNSLSTWQPAGLEADLPRRWEERFIFPRFLVA
jgi:hypothetical protein